MANKPRLPTLWEVPDALWERVEQILAVYDPPNPQDAPAWISGERSMR